MSNEQLILSPDEVFNQIGGAIQYLVSHNVSLSEAVEKFRKRYVVAAVTVNGGNQCKAAKQIGFHRNSISRILTTEQRKALRKMPKSERNYRAREAERIS